MDGEQGTSLRTRLFLLAFAILFLMNMATDSLSRSLVARTLVAMVGALVVSWLGALDIVAVSKRLAHIVGRMEKRDFTQRAKSSAEDEFLAIAEAIDGLAATMSRTLGELEAERDLLGTVLQGMQEGVLLVGEDGRIAVVNPALRDMLLLGADCVGKYPLEVLRNADLKRLLDQARNQGTPVTGEVELSGIKPRRLRVRAAPLAVETGGILTVFVDMTEVRRLETIRRDFVANVSHELRTPVTAIRSASETIRGAASRDPAAAMRFLDIIERNAERLQHLVEDLLDLSRIESKEFRLNLEKVELDSFIPYVLSLLRERAEKKRIPLHAHIAPDVPPVFVDRRGLEQVLSNLVDNAVKYCPAGAEVRVRANLTEGGVRIAVEDTGPGIEEKHLARIFERFYRIDAGRSRDVGGTGLGLSIVKHLVEAFGSSVGVDSAPGKGCTFYFSLPLRQDRSSPSLGRLSAAPAAPGSEG